MKFFCEYCGNRIDAEKEHKCPHCGASYKHNEKFKKLEEDKNKERQLNNETKQKVINHVFGIMKFSKIIAVIPFIFFTIVIVTIIIAITTTSNKKEVEQPKFNESIIEDLFDDKKEEKEVTVEFNEFAETKKYKVKVEKYEVVKDLFHEADEGYELVKFHLIVENLSDRIIGSENINCIVDGVAQNNGVYSGYSTLPFNIERKLTVKGTSTFFVPINATSYDIRYGDYVTIHIEK